jgi:hypothetical protein
MLWTSSLWDDQSEISHVGSGSINEDQVSTFLSAIQEIPTSIGQLLSDRLDASKSSIANFFISVQVIQSPDVVDPVCLAGDHGFGSRSCRVVVAAQSNH